MSRGYLLDTSVISLFAPSRTEFSAEFINWATEHVEQLFLSTIVVFELIRGIEGLRRAGGVARADRYQHWLNVTSMGFQQRLLSFDETAAAAAGRLADHAIAIGRHPGTADVLIAATAVANDLTLLTRNLKHFRPLGIDVVDPLERPST